VTPPTDERNLVNDLPLAFLRKLLNAPGPSGYESLPSGVWREEARTIADRVDSDVLGNSIAWLERPGAPIIAIEGHIDEIGLVISHIDPEGYLWFDGIGGWDAQVLVGQRVRIAGDHGETLGVIGRKALHLLKQEDRTKAVQLDDLWIDIGATSRDDARGRVEVGDAAVIDVSTIALTDDLFVSRSMDNRVGAYVALEALRLLAGERPPCAVVALAAVQEEITMAGALTASFHLEPLVAVAIDVTHSTDYPGAGKKRDDEVKLGGGPVLTRGAAVHPAVFEGLRDAARRLGLTLPIQAAARASGTDADAMIKAGAGIATGILSIPNRYMHSPNEVISLADLGNAARVIAEYVRSIEPEADFTR
jgi:endoglucanase